MNNLAFRRALISLSYPISIGAIVLLLFNDHIWRRVAPSWFTGKIGDFTWLIFAPFLLAALLAWLMPKRAELVGRMSIVITGLVFALVKTVPAFHAGFSELFQGLMGWAPATRLDPTDLLTMPALALAWLIWRHSAASVTFDSFRGWLMLSLGALATTANTSPIVNTGITCLVEQDTRIAAISYVDHAARQRFFSDDGGLTWREEPGTVECPDQYRSERVMDPIGAPWQIGDPVNAAVQYRFTRGVTVDSSRDSGQTWQQEFTLGGDEARIHHIQRNLYTLAVGPFDAMVHSPSGNLVVAMGREGVLVRTAQGEWRWIAVGAYSVPELNHFNQILSLMSGELWLALILALLVVSTLARRMGLAGRSRARRRMGSALLIVAWIGWALILLGLKPALYVFGWWAPYPEPLSLAIGAVAVIAFISALWQMQAVRREHRRLMMPILIIALIAALLFLLPFMLWVQGAIPFYSTAMFIALVLTAATLIAGRFYLRRYNVSQVSSTSSVQQGV